MAEPTEVECKVLDHTSKKYDAKYKYWPDVMKTPALPSFDLKPKDRKHDKFYYGLRIVTGNQDEAAAANITTYFKLTGCKHTTGIVHIGSNLQDGHIFFDVSTYDDLLLEVDAELDIDVFAVGVKCDLLSDMLRNKWYVDFMQLHNLQNNDDVKTFPCYHWIGPPTTEVSCTSQTSTMKDVRSNPVLVKQRRDQIDKKQKEYTWKPYYSLGYPSSLDDSKEMPLDEEFDRVKTQNFLGNQAIGGLSSGLAAARAAIENTFEKILGIKISADQSVSSLDQFETFAVQLQALNHDNNKSVAKDVPVYEGYRWVSDVEFGRQILNGVNPVIIKKCTTLPLNTQEAVKNVIPPGTHLSDEIKAGRIYICDLSEIMDGLTPRKGNYYCPAPTCLLRVNDAGQLVPIAIQLEREKGHIFVPTDHWLDWLLAKIYYRCADAQYHELMTHYISCHATMEAYGVAVVRTLPEAHPVYKLLQRHFRYTMAINSAARSALINDGGIIDNISSIGGEGRIEFIKRANNLYRVQVNNIKRSVKERGVDDPKQLPGYYYRDDGIKIWDAIEAYVKDIIDIFYKNDDDVKEDPELADWVIEVNTHAFPAYDEAPSGRGFPNKIETKAELIEYCTLIMFTGSAQHAAVNFGQFDLYGYAPNAPLSVRKPPPDAKGQVDYAYLLNAMPNLSDTVLATTVVFALAQYSPNEIFLGGYPLHWFTETEAIKAEKKFVDKLASLQKEFEDRNEGLDVPYTYLLPTGIPASITI